MTWNPLNLTVRVGCNLAYETSVPTPVLFVVKPRIEGRVLVMQDGQIVEGTELPGESSAALSQPWEKRP